MIEVELPDGTIAEFPDGTDNATIEGVLAQQFGVPSPEAAPSNPAPQSATLGDHARGALRGAGLTARSVIEGAGAPFIALTDAVGGALIDDYQPVSQTLTAAGLPQPATPGERLASDVTGGVSAAMGGVGLGNLLARSGSAVTSGVGRLLAGAPETQVLAGGAAGASAGLAREAGAGAVGQTVAGLAGGLLTPLAAPRQLGGIPFKPQAPDLNSPDAVIPMRQAQGTSKSPEYNQAVAELDQAGVPLTTGQKTGRNWLKATERSLSEIPVTGDPLQNAFESQQRAFQRELLKRSGLDDGSDMITSDNLQRARTALSQRYTEALEGKSLDLADDAFLDDLARIEAKHSEMLPFEQRKQVQDIIGQTLEEAAKREQSGSKMTGEEYQRLRSNIGEKARSTKNTYISSLYDDLKKTFDEAFGRSAGEEKFGVDRQYARLRQLEKVLERNGGPNMSEGFISPVAVAREAAGAPGGQDWQQLTRAGAAVLPDRVANSGTAQRNLVLGLLTGAGAGAIDPMSLVYGPLAMRGASGLLARGGGQVAMNPGLLADPIKRLGYPAAMATAQAGGRK